MTNLLVLSALRRKRNILPLALFAAALSSAACAGDGDGDGPGKPNRRGGHVVLSSHSDSTTNAFSADASFWGIYGSPFEYQRETFGACELSEPPGPSDRDKGEFATGSYQSGRITVEGGLQPVVLEAGASSVSGAGDLFRGGERLTVRAEAGEVPAFEGSVLAPGRVTFTEPQVTVGADPSERTIVVSPSRDLTFRWTGGVAGTTIHAFVEHNGDPHTFTGPRASCTFDAGAGAGVIPAAALERLAKSTPGVSFYFEVDSVSHVVVGDVSVQIRATAPATDATNVVYGGRARFE